MLGVALVLLDLLLLAANLAHLTADQPGEPVTIFSGPVWNGDLDGSFLELFGHLQLIGAAVVLAFLTVVRRSFLHAAWALALLVVVVDDFAQVHELQGGLLGARLGLPAVLGLRPQDLGELIVWGVEGVVVGVVLVVATVLATRQQRRESVVLLGCIVVLAVFGVGVDQAHIIIEPHVPPLVATAITLLETAGELGAMTLVVLVVHRMTYARG